MYQNRFCGRTAVITGGASGLGLKTTKRIGEEGGRVALWDLDAQRLSDACLEVGAHYIHALDVSDSEAVALATANSREALGKIDILITSAGITGAAVPVTEFPIENWLRVMAANLNGLFFCCRAIAPIMVEMAMGGSSTLHL